MSVASLEREYHLPPLGELRIVTLAVATSSTRLLVRSAHSGDQVVGSSASTHEAAAGDRVDEDVRAEVFGAELAPGTWVTLPVGQSTAVLTPTGCHVVVSGPPKVFQQVYATTLGATYTRSMVDLHTHLEYQRVQARKLGVDGLGPRVLVVGDRRGTGKSTLVQTLANYAVRLGYQPLLMDLDVGCPRFGYPECLSMYNLQYPIDVEEGTCFVPGQHVVYGSLCKNENPALLLHGVRQLITVATERMARNDRCRIGGLFVDYGTLDRALVEEAEAVEAGMSTRTAAGGGRDVAVETAAQKGAPVSQLDLLLDAILDMEVDHVFVVHSNWLRFKLLQRALTKYAGDEVSSAAELRHVGNTLRSSVLLRNGVLLRVIQVDANTAANRSTDEYLRHQRWLQYFFGTITSPLKPALVLLASSSVRLVQVGSSSSGSMSTLVPMMDDDAPVKEDAAMLTYLRPQDLQLSSRLVAVSPASAVEILPDGSRHTVPFTQLERRLKECFVTGFALVSSVEGERVHLMTSGAVVQEERGLCVYPLQSTLKSRSKKPPAPAG